MMEDSLSLSSEHQEKKHSELLIELVPPCKLEGEEQNGNDEIATKRTSEDKEPFETAGTTEIPVETCEPTGREPEQGPSSTLKAVEVDPVDPDRNTELEPSPDLKTDCQAEPDQTEHLQTENHDRREWREVKPSCSCERTEKSSETLVQGQRRSRGSWIQACLHGASLFDHEPGTGTSAGCLHGEEEFGRIARDTAFYQTGTSKQRNLSSEATRGSGQRCYFLPDEMYEEELDEEREEDTSGSDDESYTWRSGDSPLPSAEVRKCYRRALAATVDRLSSERKSREEAEVKLYISLDLLEGRVQKDLDSLRQGIFKAAMTLKEVPSRTRQDVARIIQEKDALNQLLEEKLVCMEREMERLQTRADDQQNVISSLKKVNERLNEEYNQHLAACKNMGFGNLHRGYRW